MFTRSIYRFTWVAIALGSCLNVRPRTWASCWEPHTHTHTHTRCPPGRPVSDPEDTASHQGITVLWALCCYTDCLAFGDLSVWDNTILSRQGENTYFGCFSQHQKRPPITLHGDVLLKKKSKKRLNSKTLVAAMMRGSPWDPGWRASLSLAEHLALPARERRAACRASRSTAVICERAVCLQAMSTVFLVGWESEPDYPKKTGAGVKHGGSNTVRGAQFPIKPGCKYSNFNLKSQNLRCAPWFQKPWNIK